MKYGECVHLFPDGETFTCKPYDYQDLDDHYMNCFKWGDKWYTARPNNYKGYMRQVNPFGATGEN